MNSNLKRLRKKILKSKYFILLFCSCNKLGTGDMASWLRALATPTKDLSSIPVLTKWFVAVCNSSSKGCSPLFWTSQILHANSIQP